MTWRRPCTSWRARGLVIGIRRKCVQVRRPFVEHLCFSALLSDEALRLLRQTQCQSGAMLTETHPLQGELADAMARADATMGERVCLIHRMCPHIQITHVYVHATA